MYKKILLSLLMMLLAIPAFASSKQIQGSDRIQTAIEISKNFDKADYAIIANGYVYPDALSSIAIAKKYNAPILLTRPDTIDQSVLNELQRLQTKNIFIIGGSGTVSNTIENTLKENYKVIRLAGANRYETNKVINEYVFKNPTKAIIANGHTFPDILSIAAYAYQNDIPIYLTDQKGSNLNLPNSVTSTYIIGGESTLAKAVERNTPNPTRLAGSNRYETSRVIDETFYKNKDSLFVTTGQDFADAITGVTLAANGDNIRLLKEKVSELRNDQKNITIIGGRVKDDRNTNNDKEKLVIYIVPHPDDENALYALQMIRDNANGTPNKVLSTTNGDASNIVNLINKKLKEQGYPEITRAQMAEGRLNQLKKSYQATGGKLENMVFTNMSQYEPTVETLLPYLREMSEGYKEVIVRAMGSNPEFDGSGGIEDHKMSRLVAEAFEKEDPRVKVELFQSVYDTGLKALNYPGHKKVTPQPTQEEKAKWRKMNNAYRIWDPENGFYALSEKIDYNNPNYFDNIEVGPWAFTILEVIE